MGRRAGGRESQETCLCAFVLPSREGADDPHVECSEALIFLRRSGLFVPNSEEFMRWLSAAGWFIVAGCAAVAQAQQADTMTVQLPEIVVTATRSELPIQDSPSPVESIPVHDYQRLEGGLVADVLARSSGVFLQDLGGSGALKTVFMRGSAPSQLLVLVNGNRINSFQNDLVDFSLLPLGLVDRIEVVRGGSSALYGADALAGVVNVLTRPSTNDLHAGVQAATGSYGFQRWAAEAGGGVGGLSVLGGVTQEKGADNYPFVLPGIGGGDTTARRQNSDFDLRQAYVQGSAVVDQLSRLSLTVQGVRSDRGVPGSITYPTDAARQRDDAATVLGRFETLHISGLVLSLKTGFHYSNQVYSDPDPTFPISARYRNTLVTVNPEVRLISIPGFQSVIGAEFNEGTLTGTDFDGRMMRVERAFYTSTEYHHTFDRTVFDRISLYGMLRFDSISDVRNAVTPKIGFNLRILPLADLRLRASYGRSFRAPSFNDLYYVGFNNPSLKPEQSQSVDAGLMSSWDGFGHHSLEISWFSISTRDRILFDLTTYKPENIGKTRSQGVEAVYNNVLFDGRVDLGIQYSHTDTRKLNRTSPADPTYYKHLLYIPGDLLSLSIGAGSEQYRVSLVHTLVGRRYIVEDNSQSLSPYQLTNLNVSGRLRITELHVTVTASVRNLMDKSYEVFPDYPMPGRTFRLAFELRY